MAKLNLGTLEGRNVTKTKIKVTNTGDGLSKAVAIDPKLIHWGEKVYVVMECTPGPITFDPNGSETELERIHTLRAGTATIVDKDLVASVIDAQAERIIKAEDERRGFEQLTPEMKLSTDHANGLHADGLVSLCPDCYPPAPVGAAKRVTAPAKKPRAAAAKKTPAKKAAPGKAARKR